MPGETFRNRKLDPTRPIYRQIIESICLAVVRGDLAPGDQIPSQRDLAQLLRVNPNTIQHAYRELESLGLVETRRGMGTFISSDAGRWRRVREETIRAELTRFVDIMFQLGCSAEQIVDLVRESVDSANASAAGDRAVPPERDASDRIDLGSAENATAPSSMEGDTVHG